MTSDVVDLESGADTAIKIDSSAELPPFITTDGSNTLPGVPQRRNGINGNMRPRAFSDANNVDTTDFEDDISEAKGVSYERQPLNPSTAIMTLPASVKEHHGPNFRDYSQVRWLLSLARYELPLITVAAISLIISSGVNLSLPTLAGYIIDSITASEHAAANLDNLVLGFFVLAIVTGIVSFMRTYFISLAAERVVRRLRKALFENILRQEIGFFDVTKSGELLNRLSSDTVCCYRDILYALYSDF